MPNDELPRIYWDACVPLSYINEYADRVPHIEALMRQSGKDFQLVTSVLSITEVAFAKAEQDKQLLDVATEERIASLWSVGSPIMLVEFYELIGRDAQQLMRAALPRGWSLKPFDAIHLATADRLHVKEFHTYDDRLEKFSELTKTKFKIVPPIAVAPLLIPLIVSQPIAVAAAAESATPQEQHATTETNEAKPAAAQVADVDGGSGIGLIEGEATAQATASDKAQKAQGAVAPETPKPAGEGGLGGDGS